MRIVLMTTNLQVGGTQKLVINLANEIWKKGIDVIIVYLDDSVNEFIADYLDKKGIKRLCLNRKNRSDFGILFRIKKIINRDDILHVNLFPSLYYIGILKLLKLLNNKAIYTEHSSNNNRRRYPILIPLERIIYSTYDSVVVISDNVGKRLNSWLRKDINYLVIFNGIDISLFNRKKKYFVDKAKEIKLVMVARFSEEKDQCTLIKALSNLPLKYKLFLYGDGGTINESKMLVKKLNLDNRVEFMGNSSNLEYVLSYYDIFILSSKWEGFGLSVLEAMACGLPTILSKVDGLYEIFKDNSLFFDVGNYEELEKKILLLDNDSIYLELVKKNMSFINHFDIAGMTNCYIDLYNTV